MSTVAYREISLQVVSSEFAGRHSLVEHGGTHTGPLLERAGDDAVPLITRCGACSQILTHGVPLAIVGLAVLHCGRCDMFNYAEAEAA